MAHRVAWTVDGEPSQHGRTALVTGASNGVGLGTAHELARVGARVILVVRDRARGQAAIDKIRAAVPNADLVLKLCDLGDLENVRRLAADLADEDERLDLLVNNAAVMMVPPEPTAQGHERHFGVNYLAHFALTMRVIPLMGAQHDPRVVTVISLAHREGHIDFERLDGRGRRSFELYAQSKLALALFGVELDRRLRAMGSPVKSVLAHPGFAGSNLTRGMAPGLSKIWLSLVFPFGQKLVDSARSTLRAALANDVKGGDFYGPGGRGELSGPPVPVQLHRQALDNSVAGRLWTVSEELTGLTLPSLGQRSAPPA